MLPLYIVNAFVDAPFSGNPAGVVLIGGRWPHPLWMQKVAAQLGMSETAFVGPLRRGLRVLRWFTPTVEVDLCGHATLAAAHVLFEHGEASVTFDTRAGHLMCAPAADGITIDLPADPSTGPVDPSTISGVIGAPVLRAGVGREYVVAELVDEDAVARLEPDLSRIATLGRTGLVVTAAGVHGDVVCRVFSPQCGINEDPVTGSAWCALAPWWRSRLGDAFTGRQLSRRRGRLSVHLLDGRVALTGRSHPVVRGQLLV